jgi:ATP-dependent Clp protease ATP-binding subunit ClpA
VTTISGPMQTVVNLAVQLAATRSAPVSVDDLLAALARDTTGLAGAALRDVGITYAQLRSGLVVSDLARPPHPALPREIKRLIDRAFQVAERRGSPRLETRDLLNTLLVEPPSSPAMSAARKRIPTDLVPVLLKKLHSITDEEPGLRPDSPLEH